MQWSAFCRFYNETSPHVPVALRREIAKEATRRAAPVAHRAAPLDFSDLRDRLEKAIQPR